MATELIDYQRQEVKFRKALAALRVSARQPGIPDASKDMQEEYRDIALGHLRDIVKEEEQ